MDLMDELNHKQFRNALTVCVKARAKGWLDDKESEFVVDMFEEYKHNGQLFEPTVKQFNWLKSIAFEHEGSL